MTSSTNTALWDQLRHGDEKALYALYQLHYDELLQYGLRLCGNINDSKDSINLVFAGLWANRHKLPEATHPKAYLFTCFKNRMLRAIQKQDHKLVPIHTNTENFIASTASVEETLIELQEYELLKQRAAQLLNHLTLRQQELIKLRFIEEMSYEKIALQLDLSVRTVYNSIHESIKALKKIFEQ
ncbi:sigma-70 family RNA polymerase sigma factor [Pseudoflavitalea sp. X16]|uniref:RNA polymerase sigma factor n=1 Tax=Paraflavitalea devenefica TaxID=2716334 RepID=UPI00141FB7C6|nr:sigma-70 family RNA polymerase sigma factor [Paraflavitalea devenefica]NII25457.1 sigma-70 family RNA polymerase sigma factor [Paraflavitalea devenefica]